MKKIILVVLFFTATVPFSSLLRGETYGNLSYEERQKLMEEHYARALQLYNEKNYSRAIYYWQEILKIDPEQTSPPTLIKEARSKLAEQIGPLEQSLRGAIDSGKYETAHTTVLELAEKDPANDGYKTLKTKLENISAIKAEETGNGKTDRLVRKGLSAHLSREENPRLAVNSLRYARNLNPKDASVDRLVSYIEMQYPEVAKQEEVAPGMSVTEHKLFIALNHIYEGRYDLAIFDCNEVLELEPDNILALKRKGSAYFALNQKDKAHEIWQQALKLAPGDTEIKKFLSSK